MDSDANKAASWAKSAMTALERDSLPPTPENYAVYYAYFSGTHPGLKSAMDQLLAEFGNLNQSLCAELYKTHISLEAEHNILNATATSLEDELNRVMGVLNKSAQGTTQYHKTLDQFTGDLESSASLDDLRSAVARVASETKVMAEQNLRLHSQLAQSNQQLTEMRFNLDQVRKDSLLDPLTEIGNRKFFNAELARCTQESAETGLPLSILMADIDYFKKFNDTYGHLVGDQVLKLVARTLIENLKGRDIIARYGGEEFVILLPQTCAADAEKVANQLRMSLGSKQVTRKKTNEQLGSVTISLGVTEYCPRENTDALIARADAALYDAKQTGRNKVVRRALTDEEKAAIQLQSQDNGADLGE